MPTAQPAGTRAVLNTLLGDHPATHALRHGAISSSRLSMAFADVAVPNQAFKRVVRALEFDVAELALMTFLMARSRNVPLRMLPVVVMSRNPLPHLICDAERRLVTPEELHGCRIGVRAYATTTAAWIRALLADPLGRPLTPIEWITLEDGHVADVDDPPRVRRARPGVELIAMLRSGIVDAAIVDRVPSDPRFVPVVPDPESVFAAWQARHHARPLNHVVVVREALADDETIVRELFRLFRESRDAGGPAVDLAATPLGFEANRTNLEVAIGVADAQGLLARTLTVDDLVTDAIMALR